MTPRIIGKMLLIVSETSLTEFSIPPICAKSDVEIREANVAKKIDFFITEKFRFLMLFSLKKNYT